MLHNKCTKIKIKMGTFIQWIGCFEILITLILNQLLQIISILEIRATSVAIRSVNCEFLL